MTSSRNLSTERLKRSFSLSLLRNSAHCQKDLPASFLKIKELILTDTANVSTLNQVLVSKLPKSALARFIRNSHEKNNAANGPVTGNIPIKTPKPNPQAIFCGVSSIRNNLRNNALKNCAIFFIQQVLCSLRQAALGPPLAGSSRFLYRNQIKVFAHQGILLMLYAGLFR